MDTDSTICRLEAALNVTEYTEKIDSEASTGKAKRVVNQIKELCAILTGIVLGCDYKRGQELFAERSYEENEEFFQTIFEIGRRHKIMNPEKMRSAYGKLMYLLSVSATYTLCITCKMTYICETLIGLDDPRGQGNAWI